MWGDDHKIIENEQVRKCPGKSPQGTLENAARKMAEIGGGKSWMSGKEFIGGIVMIFLFSF